MKKALMTLYPFTIGKNLLYMAGVATMPFKVVKRKTVFMVNPARIYWPAMEARILLMAVTVMILFLPMPS